MKYFLRAFKYLISLCLLYFVVIYVMWIMNISILTPQQTLETMISSQRGLIMIIAILALSISYPVFGFMRQEVSGDISKHREQIISALAANGFRLTKEEGGVMTFASDNMMKKISYLFEDEVTITQVGDKLVVEGIRRAVSYIIYRLESAISFAERAEE